MAFPKAELRTERCLLRRPTIADAQAIFDAYASDPEATRFVQWPPHEDLRDTREHIEAGIDAWDLGHGHMPWLVERSDDGALLGSVGITRHAHRVECGYIFSRSIWGQGYATECLRAVVAHCFDDPGIHRVYALTDCANVGSARVMEKSGMQLEGRLRRFAVHPNVSPEARDCFIYAIVRDDPAGP